MTNLFLNHFYNSISLESSLDLKDIQEIDSKLGFILPNDYKEIVKVLNGFEGTISNSYIVFWSVNEVIELNEGYGVDDFAPGIFLFGSDGGNQAYGFDVRDDEMRIITIPFIVMDIDDIEICGEDMNEFYQFLLDV
ncbi:SMI1/KNR4 family protein [Paenibacillus polygoni]|uniref:SMI1/KNR4 family protein n=1 Tax=Paenibacillus polygoni TaxID=3050112 RepID=A0ABY8X6J5_9BACL|nr:SMI1/KNR4 family protein [Paenibacillus polygoni]WIV21156.1 SMI1/KNR4 family protein [Paenibacillus polygoni]